jgi:hypothetical protein
LFACGALLAWNCEKKNNENDDPGQTGPIKYDVTYVEDENIFCNPERGLYVPNIHYFRNNQMPSAPPTVKSLRAMRSAGKTFSYSEFYMKDYVYRDFSDEVLEFVRNNFELHREADIETIYNIGKKTNAISGKRNPVFRFPDPDE